jgi:hypothetical protein
LVNNTGEIIVLGWAVPEKGGDRRVNYRSNSYVIYQLWRRGFRINPRWTLLLRGNCSLDSLKPALMVFSRSQIPYPLVQRRAAIRIVGADIDRLKRNNRSNSSLTGAVMGKAVRALARAKVWMTNGVNLLRLLRYDVARVARWDSVSTPIGTGEDAYFFPVCFTCGKHFRFARLALLSLARCRPRVKEAYVYMDKGDPLSDSECELLRSESQYPVIFRVTRYPMASWGPKIQLSEIMAYRESAQRMGGEDFLVKFDSDVLFLSDNIFRFVANSRATAVGTPVARVQPSEVQENYLQGGCYFIRAIELGAILNMPVRTASRAPTKWGEIPEDQFISGLLRRCGVKFLYNDFLYFDPVFIASGTEEEELERRLLAIPSEAGVLHFEGNQWTGSTDRT